ncbi:glycosyltransferase family 4 protein [Deltaproteobacteria bacterium IMCC39524]|nr:glycosyltransferase family 4 protein [Deltaproteobacteria bacterium IMCC39524]
MKLLHIVLNDFTNDSRVLRACKVGRDAGFKVQVFALYGDGLPKLENLQNYSLQRFPLVSKNWGRNYLILMVKYFEAFLRMIVSGLCSKPDIVHVHDLNAIMIGYVVAKFTGAKLIYDSHELWSGSSSIIKFPDCIKKPALFMQRFIARRANVNISVGGHVAKVLEEEFGVDKVHVIRNIPELAKVEKKDLFRKEFCIDADKTIILYQGAVAAGRGVETLVSAMPFVKDNGVLVFMGDGHIKQDVIAQVTEMGLCDRVFFHPAVAPAVLLGYSSSADIGVSPIEPICKSYELCLPNKLFEYIHAGLATIVSDLPEMAQLVETYELGSTFSNNDPKSLAVAINRYLDHPEVLSQAQRNSVAATKILNWENESTILEDIYRKLS